MLNLLVEVSKYILIVDILGYTLYGFLVFGYKNRKKQNRIFLKQRALILTMHFIGYLILYLHEKDIMLLILYAGQVVLFFIVLSSYQFVYHNLSRLVLNNMLMLLMTSFVMIARLSARLAFKQFCFAAAALIVSLVIPFFIEHFRKLENFGWLYCVLGICMLLAVSVFGTEKYGAKNWISIGGISVQPSEFVKILFVFGVSALLAKAKRFGDIVKISITAAVPVLVLVFSKDLGNALIYFMMYICVLYVATGRFAYFGLGMAAGSAAACIAYQLFSHVRVRVLAWRDPFSYIDKEGYQIAQSLFAIGTGGWFGMGLCEGLPTSIPVRESDFIFSAIAEELGGFFAVCLIFVYVSTLIMFVNISLKMRRSFYKLTAFGLSVLIFVQVFLNIGGVIKFIPSTGVTLPLLSYGGSSVVSTIIIFNVIQGMYVLDQIGVSAVEEETKPAGNTKSRGRKLSRKKERRKP